MPNIGEFLNVDGRSGVSVSYENVSKDGCLSSCNSQDVEISLMQRMLFIRMVELVSCLQMEIFSPPSIPSLLTLNSVNHRIEIGTKDNRYLQRDLSVEEGEGPCEISMDMTPRVNVKKWKELYRQIQSVRDLKTITKL